MEEYKQLKLENQLCFPLYAASKEIIRKYKPFLDKVNLTYTQYITMMVIWEHEKLNVKQIGDRLFLDSGTLTSVLKQLESKGYVKRVRSKKDERNLSITITEKGKNLKNIAKDIPIEISKCVNLSEDESIELYKLLYKILNDTTK